MTGLPHAHRKRWSYVRLRPDPKRPWIRRDAAVLRVGGLTMSWGYNQFTAAFEVDYESHGFMVKIRRDAVTIST